MARFEDLPNEVVRVLLTHIADIGDLAALSLLCRRLHTMADMKTRRQYYHIRMMNDHDVGKAIDTLYEILDLPKLALYVGYFQMNYALPTLNRGRIPPLPKLETKTEMRREKLLRRAAQNAGFSGKMEKLIVNSILSYGRSKVDNKSVDIVDADLRVVVVAQALTVLFLSLCTNIVKLKLKIAPWDNLTPLMEFLKHANGKGHGYLHHLRSVWIYEHIAKGGDDWSSDEDSSHEESRWQHYERSGRYFTNCDLFALIKCFHRLPAIESFGTGGVVMASPGSAHLHPKASNITKIHLIHSDLGSDTLTDIIRHSKVLYEFKFSTGGRGTREWQNWRHADIDIKDIGKALHCHKSTLRVLDLDFDEYIEFAPEHDMEDWESEEESEEDDESDSDLEISKRNHGGRRAPKLKAIEVTRGYHNSIGSLHDFSALTHLSVGIKAMTGGPFRLVDGLPPSLESLCIRGYESEGNRVVRDFRQLQVEELMRMRRERLPNLTRIKGIKRGIPGSLNVNWDQMEDYGHWRYKSTDEESDSDSSDEDSDSESSDEESDSETDDEDSESDDEERDDESIDEEWQREQ